MIAYKQALGWNLQVTFHGKLMDLQYSEPEIYFCFVHPFVRYCVQHLQNEDMDLEIGEVLNVDIYNWEQALKRKYKDHGWWSQNHISDRLKLPISNPDHVRDYLDRDICRGVEYRFLRLLVLTVHDFDTTSRGRKRCRRVPKVFGTRDEEYQIGNPLTNPPVGAKVPRYHPYRG